MTAAAVSVVALVLALYAWLQALRTQRRVDATLDDGEELVERLRAALSRLRLPREIRRAHDSMTGVCGHPILAGCDMVLDGGYIFCSPACADERRIVA